MTTTTPLLQLEKVLDAAVQSTKARGDYFGDPTEKALEECGEILAEVLNALHMLWNVTITVDPAPDELLLMASVVADTGERLRATALHHGLVQPHASRGEDALQPGPQLDTASSAVYHLREILAAHRSDS